MAVPRGRGSAGRDRGRTSRRTEKEGQWRLDIDGRPPHCLGSTVIDLAALPLLEPTDADTLIDAMGVLENLTRTLTGSMSPLQTRELRALADGEFPATLKPRHQRRVADQLRQLVTEVDTHITWR